MADTTPLADVIAKYADQKMLEAIAAEYNKGGLLMIGTTDLDAQRPVIWNIGASRPAGTRRASISSARSAGLGRHSGTLPAGPDRRPNSTARSTRTARRWRRHRPALPLSAVDRHVRQQHQARAPRLHHPQCRLDPDYAMAERRTITIAGRAIVAMLAASGVNDVLRTYFVSRATRSTTTSPISGGTSTRPRRASSTRPT